MAGTTEASTALDRTRDVVVKYGFIAVTVVLFIYFALTEPAFATSSSIFSMLKFVSVTAILGLGVMFTMVVGGLDLSIGSVAGLSVQMAAMTMVFYNMTGATAVVVVLLAGAAAGLANASLPAVSRLPAPLATPGLSSDWPTPSSSWSARSRTCWPRWA